MASSTGFRGLFKEGLAWVAGGVVVALSLFYSENISRGIASFTRSANENGAELAMRVVEAHQEPDLQRGEAMVGKGRRIFLRADRNNMFHVKAYINGRPVNSLVDTGATFVAIPYEAAAAIGLRPRQSEFTIKVRTANGISLNAPVVLRKVRIGEIVVHDVDALITPPGMLHTTLVGMEFLKRLKRVNIRGRELELVN